VSQARVKRPIIGAIYGARDDQHVYGYSGNVQGDVRLPASLPYLDFITPLQDYLVDLYYVEGAPVDTTTADSALGLEVKIQDETVLSWQPSLYSSTSTPMNIRQVWPGGQQIQITRLNTTQNNTQISNCSFVGMALPDVLGQDTDKAVGGGYNWPGNRKVTNTSQLNMKDLYVASRYIYGGI
jgi:hypothetical protein